MALSVTNQAYIFLVSVVGGLAIGVLFDLFRVIRKVIRTSNIITQIQDIIFWILVVIISFTLIFIINDGELRWYEFLGIFIGVLLYSFAISEYFMKAMLAGIAFIINVIKYIVKPFKPIINFICKIVCNLIVKAKYLNKKDNL